MATLLAGPWEESIMATRTQTVRNRVIGDARKALEQAAGNNTVLSKNEAKTLPADLQKVVGAARKTKARVEVDDAVNVYAKKVSTTLAAVDVRGKGNLTDAEAKKIRDPALRARVLDVRAALLGGPGGSTAAVPTSAALANALQGPVASVAAWWDSGDNGVNVSVVTVGRAATWDAALAKITQDPGVPWTHAETRATLEDISNDVTEPQAAVAAFVEEARSTLESFRDDEPDAVAGFVAGVTAALAGLAEVRLATGRDLGGQYLIGKTANGYVGVTVQAYSDG